MAIAFSSSGDIVMTRQIAPCSQSSFTDTAEEFDVMSTAMWISEQNFRRVCKTVIYTSKDNLWNDNSFCIQVLPLSVVKCLGIACQ